jgi:hypothetical protein
MLVKFSVIVPTGDAAMLLPFHATVGADPPRTLSMSPLQLAPAMVQETVYQTGFPAASYTNIVTNTMPDCCVMVAPQPDSAAFHHSPVSGDALEVSMVNDCARAGEGETSAIANTNASDSAHPGPRYGEVNPGMISVPLEKLAKAAAGMLEPASADSFS